MYIVLTGRLQHVATLASVIKPTEYCYPKAKIDECWEKVLLNQCQYIHIFFPATELY